MVQVQNLRPLLVHRARGGCQEPASEARIGRKHLLARGLAEARAQEYTSRPGGADREPVTPTGTLRPAAEPAAAAQARPSPFSRHSEEEAEVGHAPKSHSLESGDAVLQDLGAVALHLRLPRL